MRFRPWFGPFLELLSASLTPAAILVHAKPPRNSSWWPV